jgi:hypothetical protein
VTVVELKLDRGFDGYMWSYTNLLPGGLSIGDPESGWALAAPQCVMPDGNGRVAVGLVRYTYFGTPGTLEVVENPMTGGRGVWDCDEVGSDWCVRGTPSGHGGVNTDAPPGECGAPPVWSVYRVSAHRSDPTLWYVSPPDSGYSIDDIPPAQVLALKIPERLRLSWQAGVEPDLDHYTVYATRDDGGTGASWAVARTEDAECALPDTTVGRYLYVTASDLSGNESEPSELLWNSGTAIPEREFLSQNVPNPFNPVTVVRFGLPRRAGVRLAVYDVSGREVRVLADGEYQPGEHDVVWDGRDGGGRSVAAGVYFYKMESGQFQERRKMILLK